VKFPLLALILFIIFAIAMYVYLRHELVKSVPSNKYSNITLISLGLGVISCLALIFLLDKNSPYAMSAPCIGSIAALSGFFIGVLGIFQARNESPLMRYGGLILSTVGFINIPFAIPILATISILSIIGYLMSGQSH
jgi:hypothetical protein